MENLFQAAIADDHSIWYTCIEWVRNQSARVINQQSTHQLNPKLCENLTKDFCLSNSRKEKSNSACMPPLLGQLPALSDLACRVCFLQRIARKKKFKILWNQGDVTYVTKCSPRTPLWKAIFWFIQEKRHLCVINVTSHFWEQHNWKDTNLLTSRKRSLCVINVRKDFQKRQLWNLTS